MTVKLKTPLKIISLSVAYCFAMSGTAWALDYNDLVGHWESTSSISAVEEGVEMVADNAKLTFKANTTGSFIYDLRLNSPQIPETLSRHQVKASVSYSMTGNKLTQRMVSPSVKAGFPSTAAVSMAAQIQSALNRPSATIYTVKMEGPDSLTLIDSEADITYRYKRTG